VEIAAGALGAGVPERPVQVSPQHRVLFGGADCELYFGTDEVLVPAIQMVGRPGIGQRLQPVTYVHVMFDRHQIVRTHGMWSESFQPGDRVLDGMPDPQRDEILRLFPELAEPGFVPGRPDDAESAMRRGCCFRPDVWSGHTLGAPGSSDAMRSGIVPEPRRGGRRKAAGSARLAARRPG
jgi:hypothetical protein